MFGCDSKEVIIIMSLQGVILWVLCGVAVGMGSSPLLVSNFDPSRVNEFATLAAPLEVPPSIQRNLEPRPPTPIHQKYNLQHRGGKVPLIDIQKIRPHMVHNDFVMMHQDEPPQTFFQNKFTQDYHILTSKQFEIMLSNPSGIFTLCINEIFSDCESIHKSLKKPLPFCIDPYTKYPLHFNLYVTSRKNREIIKAAIFLNATLKFEGQDVINRLWLQQVKFNLFANHLKLYSLDLKNCKQDHNIISIKNPTKYDLQLLIQYRHKKMYLNNQVFDQKVTVNSGNTFRFLIQGRNSTMTVFTYNPSHPQKTYPPLYLPLYCLDPAVIEHIPIGILTQPNMAFTYPLLVSSHSMSPIHIRQIELHSSSQTVKLNKFPTHKLTVQSNQKQVQVASFSVYSAKYQAFKNSISIVVRYTSSNGSFKGEMFRQITYSQLHKYILVGNNRFYHVDNLRKGTDLNQAEKIRYFNYSLTNFMQIPIRPELINFDHQFFRMHWYRYTGFYLYPNRVKEEILLQYIGPKNIPLSPVRYAATLDLNGGMVIPFEIMIFDNTLICTYQGKEDRCSKLKNINFGHQKSEHKQQQQVVTFKNLNPRTITMTIQPFSLAIPDLKLNLHIGRPFPYYSDSVQTKNSKIYITLHSGYAINITFQVKVKSNIVADVLLAIDTPFEKITPKLKFHFESGDIAFTPRELTIGKFDHIHRGQLKLISTFHEQYSIKQIISNTNLLKFTFNQSKEYSRLQKVIIPFLYHPQLNQYNLTDSCCDQQWMKLYHLDDNQIPDLKFDVELITSSEMQARGTIFIQNKFSSLLNQTSKELKKKVLKADKGSTFCFDVINPYELPLKYSVALMRTALKQKPNDYFTYFKYVKREKVDTYFCVKGHGRNLNFINPASLRQLFRLEDKPTELVQKDGMFINKNPAQQTNLSNNEYLRDFTQTGKEICYKFTSTLYFKLLIQSEVVNDVLQAYPFEVMQKLIEKEYHYLMQSHFSNIFDEFYEQIQLNLTKYCSMQIYPVFRFCQMIPLKNLSPPPLHHHRQKQSYLDTRVIPVNSKHEQCFMLSGFQSDFLSFHMVLTNNFSQFDSYNVQLELEEARLQVGDIFFELNHNINHSTFIKHYFPDLHSSLNSHKELAFENGITHRHKIVPLYFTSQDYDQSFGVFKGNRFFQISNTGDIDVQFTHYGFNNIENVLIYQGFQIEQVGMPAGTFKIQANSKATFQIGFKLDQNFHINSTNKLYHHELTLYLYKGNSYHIQLHLVMKVADNILSKIKAKIEEKEYKSKNTLGYIVLNLISFGFICSVILQLKKEEEEKGNRLKMMREKLKKISQVFPKKHQREQSIDQKGRKKMHILAPTSIGTRVDSEQNQKFQLSVSVSEQDLAFFKTLKVKEEKSIIISQSSQGEYPPRMSPEEYQRQKTDEQEKSMKSQSGSKSQEVKQQDINSEQIDNSEQELQSQGSQNSISESILPDGFSVCNQELDIDDNMDFQFGFQSQKVKKMEKKNSNEEYKWFESHNPLKEKYEPFPWMNQNQSEKKKTKHKIRKQE